MMDNEHNRRYSFPTIPQKGQKRPHPPKININDLSIDSNSLSPSPPCFRVLDEKENRNIEDFYEIGQVLGAGNSVVHYGRDKITQNEVAIKIINKKKFSHCRSKEKDETKQMMIGEINIMKKIVNEIGHPNIVRMYDVFETEKKLYMVLELLTGGELFDRIEARGHYTEKDTAILFTKIVSAVNSLHQHNIIHRDLKPENLIFQTPAEDSEIKITDFGLSMIYGTNIGVHSLVGTPGYVSPEILTRTVPSYDKPCDIWSLGVILYILLAGFPPFSQDGDHKAFEQIKQATFNFPSPYFDEISLEARDLISHMLQKDPQVRYTANDVLKHQWIQKYSVFPPIHLVSTQINLKTFNARRKFKATVMACVWSFEPRRMTHTLHNVTKKKFSMMDIQFIRKAITQVIGNSTLDFALNYQKFVEVLQNIGLGHLHEKPRIFTLFDTDNNGQIDWRELLVGLSTLCTDRSEELLHFCFKLYDSEDCGYLTKEDISRVLEMVVDGPFADELEQLGKLADIFKSMDENSNNKISYEDFSKYLLSNPLFFNAFISQTKKFHLLSFQNQISVSTVKYIERRSIG